MIAGRNAVRGAPLRQAHRKYLVARGTRNGSLGDIVSKAKAQGVAVKEVDPKRLEFLCPGANHQGIAALAAAHEYASVEDMLALADERGEPPFLIVADELNDPHNLGAIMRTAECAGAHGVIIPKRRSVSITETVAKTSAGAVEYMPCARVTNMARTIEQLQEAGLWIAACDMDGDTLTEADFKRDL
mgnify:CR=1 FL=1